MTEQNEQFNKKGKSGEWKAFFYAEFIDGGYVGLLVRRAFVYFTLSKHVKWGTNICWPSYERIMNLSGYKSKTPVSQALVILEALNMIHIRRSRGRAGNKYELLEPKYWIPANSLARDTIKMVLNQWKKRYQMRQLNGIASDTGIKNKELININKELLDKEIQEKRKALVDKLRIKP